MKDYMICPHCFESQDQSKPREWHSLGHADEIKTECDHCGKPIMVKANLHYEVCEVSE